MLCSLLDMPSLAPHLERLNQQGVRLRRPNPWERGQLWDFIAENFSPRWADEACVAFSHQPVSCYIAVDDQGWLGFAAYECSRRNYFGPTGVLPSARGRGLGTALLLAALLGLRQMGYTYAIIGGVREPEYYQKTVGAWSIPIGPPGGIYALGPEADLTV